MAEANHSCANPERTTRGRARQCCSGCRAWGTGPCRGLAHQGLNDLNLSAPHGARRDGVAADAALGEQVHAEAWHPSSCYYRHSKLLPLVHNITRKQEVIGVSSGRCNMLLNWKQSSGTNNMRSSSIPDQGCESITYTATQNLPSQLSLCIMHQFMQLIESPLVSATMAPLVHA